MCERLFFPSPSFLKTPRFRERSLRLPSPVFGPLSLPTVRYGFAFISRGLVPVPGPYIPSSLGCDAPSLFCLSTCLKPQNVTFSIGFMLGVRCSSLFVYFPWVLVPEHALVPSLSPGTFPPFFFLFPRFSLLRPPTSFAGAALPWTLSSPASRSPWAGPRLRPSSPATYFFFFSPAAATFFFFLTFSLPLRIFL